ncbi:MAG: SDR family oxidoreductase [Planctomycetota bacterium]|jgi:3-oxoacyl-[acyl-carrier protein] reductase
MVANARRALVTGGNSGIGRCVAELLARDGCNVAVLDLDVSDAADGVIDGIQSSGHDSLALEGDVRDAAFVRSAVESMVGRWGGVDILVTCAGIFRDQVIWKMEDQEWSDVIDVDLSGPFHCCRAVSPVMRAEKWGSIVNISSINGMRGKFGQTNYSAAKAGVIGLTKALARELARSNVTVNAVAPGLIETPILQGMTEAAREAALGEILLGRPGRVQDVGELVAFLCSDRARFITGEVIRVDGGQYI